MTRASPASRAVRVPVALVTLLGACGSPSGPVPAPREPPDPPRTVVLQDPESTVLAAAVVVPGSAWELPGTEGLTMLAATTLLEQVRPALGAVGARSRVDCGPATFTFTLVAPRDEWSPALDIFLDGLFRPAPGAAALERARSRLRASLTLDRASPAWQARLAVRRALHGDTLSSGWLGPACGVPETLGLFDRALVRAAAHRFAPRLAHIGVIAPVDPGPIRARLVRRMPGGAVTVPAPRTVRAGRVFVERNTVTAWLAVAFPFGPRANVEAIRLLGVMLEDAVAPGVERPESFTTGHEVQRHGAGGMLIVHAVTTPEAAAGYADRIEALTRQIARVGVARSLYDRVLRRHRGQRLLSVAAPEVRAANMARRLALGDTTGMWPALDITPTQLREAAAALGTPARSVVGPASARGAVP